MVCCVRLDFADSPAVVCARLCVVSPSAGLGRDTIHLYAFVHPNTEIGRVDAEEGHNCSVRITDVGTVFFALVFHIVLTLASIGGGKTA